jgi:2-C-methyl-D-erythritol 4-phosphate cytidylyltransferase
MKTVVIIPAAGMGRRMGASRSKQYIPLNGLPLLVHTLKPFEESHLVDAIILTVPIGDKDYCKKEVVDMFGFKKVTDILHGGKERQDSVRIGLNMLDSGIDFVIIHDGVRPFITHQIIADSIHGAETSGACVVAVPAKDTIKAASEDHLVLRTLERKDLWLVQTPQTFRYEIIKEAHEKALADGFHSTDDSALVERLGNQVSIVQGSYNNIKITTSEDLIIAEAILASLKIDD